MPEFPRRWALGLGLLALVAAATLLGSRTRLIRLKQEWSDGAVLEARAGRPVGQSFQSYYPGLAQIAVWPAEPPPPDDQAVVLRLRAGQPDAPDRLVVQRTVGEIRDGQWLRIDFEPLDDSAGVEYFFFIEPVGDLPLGLAANGQDLYPEGELLAGAAGDLVFQANYHGPAAPTARVLLSRLARNKPGVFGQPAFYPLLLASVLVALAGTAISFARRWRDEAAPNR